MYVISSNLVARSTTSTGRTKVKVPEGSVQTLLRQQGQSGTGRKTEPAHYDLMCSFLKHRPLSKPSLMVVEGTSSSQQCVTNVEVRAVHEVQPQPGTALHSPQVTGPSQPARPSHERIPDVPEPSEEQRPAQSREAAHIPYPIGTPPRPPNKTRTRTIRPATEKKEMLEVFKELKTIMTESLVATKASNEKQISILTEMNERDKQKHDIEMKIKEKQLAVLNMKLAQMEINQ